MSEDQLLEAYKTANELDLDIKYIAALANELISRDIEIPKLIGA
ncbi:sporulation histidine kinase inhibitor Sda [Alkalihalobacterium alkalicellulosilyticum]|nr:sporulation histidine kinase inhibitor Sda [Bacillus alkalicellulosilyticus]